MKRFLYGCLLAACASASPAWADTCPFPVPIPVQCSTVSVPANHRDAKQAAKVGFFYVRVAAKQATPNADPIVILSGGPGSAGSQSLLSAGFLYLGLLDKHDLIFIDQRGTGFSTPSLLCPAIPAPALLHNDIKPADVAACLQPLKQAGYDTAWFDTAQSAQDVIALRKHLGISRWNLLATSYGTVLAQEIMRRDEAAIGAVVLNSPTLSRASMLDTDTVLGVVAAWNQIFADCQSAPACNAQAPGIRNRFLSVAQALLRKPLPATWVDPQGKPGSAPLTPAALQDIANMTGGSGKGAPVALSSYSYLFDVVNGSLPASSTVTGAIYMPPGFWQLPSSTALGLNLSVTCREVMPFIDVAQLRKAAQVAWPFVVPDRLMEPYTVACPIWNAGKADGALNQPVKSNLPVLLLTGDYDMAAPSHLAQKIAASLPKAQLVSFRGVGHAVFESDECARQLTAQFFLTPTATAVPSCVPVSPAASFKLWKP